MPEMLIDAAGRAERQRRRRGRQVEGPRTATVRRSDGGRLLVTVDGLGDDRLIGPCRWARPDGAGQPPAGTRCLVLFADAGVGDPWVVAFDGWPA